MQHNNIIRLQAVARALDHLKDEVVFVGGAVTSLYFTTLAAPEIRVTEDIDCVIEIESRGKYYLLQEKLRELNFKEDVTKGAPICRWIYNGLVVDIMPTDPDILGFSNLWYKHALDNSVKTTLPDSQVINIFPIEYFIATKLEALKHRNGGTDIRWSHDFEDIITVIANRDNLIQELLLSDSKIQKYLSQEFQKLLKDERVDEAIDSALGYSSAAAYTLVKTRIEEIAQN